MEQRQLGKDGPYVPVLGLGAWPIGGGMGNVDEAAAIATVRAAIDNGMTLLDTAEGYRHSESVLGKALRDGYRQRCFLATKVSRDYSPAGIRSAIENSLRALNTDYVDLYQIHSWNPAYPIADSMDAMLRLQAEGKTRYIGVSNFTAPQMQTALDVGFFHANQIAYNLFDREIEADVIPFCEQHGIAILAHSPLAKGLLTGRYRHGHRFAPDDERSRSLRFQPPAFDHYLDLAERYAAIAREKGVSLMHMAVAWILRQPIVANVILGAKNPDQILDHLKALDIAFTDDELARIDAIHADLRPTPVW